MMPPGRELGVHELEAGQVQVLPHVEQHEVERAGQRLQRPRQSPAWNSTRRRQAGARQRLARMLDLVFLELERHDLAARGARGGAQPHGGVAVGSAELEDAPRLRAGGQ